MEIVFLSQWVKVQLSIKLFLGHFLNYLLVLSSFYVVGLESWWVCVFQRQTLLHCTVQKARLLSQTQLLSASLSSRTGPGGLPGIAARISEETAKGLKGSPDWRRPLLGSTAHLQGKAFGFNLQSFKMPKLPSQDVPWSSIQKPGWNSTETISFSQWIAKSLNKAHPL